MFVIRKEQIEVLRNASRERFIRHLQNQVENDFQDRLMEKDAPEVTREWLEQAISKAGDYGITQEREISLFVFLMVMLGEDFDKQPGNRGIRRILDAESYHQEEKMELVYKLLDED